jgi:hypothetical protein
MLEPLYAQAIYWFSINMRTIRLEKSGRIAKRANLQRLFPLKYNA